MRSPPLSPDLVRSMSALPLDLRLPNPPPLFLAREQELDWLDAAVPRAPLTLIWGAAGSGKSALITAWAQRSGHDPDLLLYLSLPPLRGLDALAEALLGCLARAQLLGGALDLHELSRQPLAALAASLDMADRSGWWIVWDDAHTAAPDALRQTLELIARYARRGRWIVLGREPAWTLPAQTLLLQPLTAAPPAPAAPGAHPPAPWSQPQLAALTLLRAAARPVPIRWLQNLCACTPAELDALVAARQARATPAGVALDLDHTTRDAGPSAPPARITHMVQGCAQATSAALVMEGVRLALAHGQDEALSALLTRRFALIRDQGHMAELWSHLRDEDRPALVRWQLRCASTLGDVQALRALERPADDTWEGLATWCNALHHLGRHGELVTSCEQALSAWSAPDEAQRDHLHTVLLLRASSLLTLGELDRAQAALDALPPMERWLEARADILGIRVLIHQGQREQALARVAAHRAAYAALEPAYSVRSAYALVYLLYTMQELEQAARIAAQVFEDPARPVVLLGTQWILLGAIALETARFERALRSALNALRSYDAPSYNRACALDLAIATHTADGDLEQAHALQLTLIRELPHYPSEFTAHARVLGIQLAITSGEPPLLPEVPPDATMSAELRGQLAMHEHLYALLHSDAPGPPPPCEDDELPMRAMDAALRAYQALRDGQPDAAAELPDWIAQLTAAGWRRSALTVAQTCCELTLIQRPDTLAAHAQTFTRLAQGCGAARPMAEALAFSLMARASTHDEVEAFLREHPDAALANRRLRAALGQPQRLHHIDLAIVQALRTRHAWASQPATPPDPLPAWGYDAARRVAWSEHGRTCSLGNKRLAHRLLCALARRGALSKEAISAEVWGEPDYHPLHHDNRLRLLVKKLRAQFDEALGAQHWIDTLEDGYALRQPFHFDDAGEG
jgi:tetratricopeptide (TPR) repeat protein